MSGDKDTSITGWTALKWFLALIVVILVAMNIVNTLVASSAVEQIRSCEERARVDTGSYLNAKTLFARGYVAYDSEITSLAVADDNQCFVVAAKSGFGQLTYATSHSGAAWFNGQKPSTSWCATFPNLKD